MQDFLTNSRLMDVGYDRFFSVARTKNLPTKICLKRLKDLSNKALYMPINYIKSGGYVKILGDNVCAKIIKDYAFKTKIFKNLNVILTPNQFVLVDTATQPVNAIIQ